jgi:hypothetical protein
MKVIELNGDTPYQIVVIEVDGVLRQVHLFENEISDINGHYISKIEHNILLERVDTIEQD